MKSHRSNAPRAQKRSVFSVPDDGEGIRVVLTSCSAEIGVEASGTKLWSLERYADVFLVSLAGLLPTCANFLTVRPGDTEVWSAVV